MPSTPDRGPAMAPPAPVRSAHSAHHRCPKCGSALKRVRRRPLDRLLSRLISVHRYHCSGCSWQGLQRTRS